MKKAFITLSFCSIMFMMISSSANSENVVSQHVDNCVSQLPPVILISQDSRDMNFTKSKFIDAFWNYDATQKGEGVALLYENSFCQAKISLYQDKLGRLNNSKIQSSLKNEVSFPYQRQVNRKVSKVKFYGAYGQDDDFSNTLMLANYKNNVLKIRFVCSVLPRFSEEEYVRRIDEMTTIFSETVVSSLDSCLK